MSYNQSSRLFYDTSEEEQHRILSEKPLQWYTTDTQQNRTLEYSNNINDVDVDSQLRLFNNKVTRLNDHEYASAELFGTAPYMLQRGTPENEQVDTESNLIFGDYGGFNICRRPIIEEYEYFDNQVLDPNQYSDLELKVEPMSRIGDSTRVMYRNQVVNKN